MPKMIRVAIVMLQIERVAFLLVGLVYVIGVFTIPIAVLAFYYFKSERTLIAGLRTLREPPSPRALRVHVYIGLLLSLLIGATLWILTGLGCLDICANPKYLPIIHHQQLVAGITAFTISAVFVLLPVWLINRWPHVR